LLVFDSDPFEPVTLFSTAVAKKVSRKAEMLFEKKHATAKDGGS
jgi:hypothetical protein